MRPWEASVYARRDAVNNGSEDSAERESEGQALTIYPLPLCGLQLSSVVATGISVRVFRRERG